MQHTVRMLQMIAPILICVKFRTENFSVIDAPRLERLTKIDEDQLKALMKNNPRRTTRKISGKYLIYRNPALKAIYTNFG